MLRRVMLALLTLAVLTLLISSVATIPGMAAGQGKHYGELKMIEANIEFFGSIGTTVTDSTGITYYYAGLVFHDDIIYIPEYWGTYPLFKPGTQVPVKLTITNLGPRAVAKHTVVTETCEINLDGSNGAALIAPQSQYIEVALGETKMIDASFTLPTGAKGLNRFAIKLLHHKNDINDASLILNQEGVFCPPDSIVLSNGTAAPARQRTINPKGKLSTSWGNIKTR